MGGTRSPGGKRESFLRLRERGKRDALIFLRKTEGVMRDSRTEKGRNRSDRFLHRKELLPHLTKKGKGGGFRGVKREKRGGRGKPASYLWSEREKRAAFLFSRAGREEEV